jgi:GAF domain-containing protein
VPYARCGTCSLISYAPRSGGTCPNCGAPVNMLNGDGAGDPERRLDRLLRLTRELLDTNVAMLSEITAEQEVVRRAAGEWPGFGSLAGASLPLDDTFCRQLLEGRIGNVIPDVQTDRRVRRLAPATQFGVGAWIGVPIEPSDVELYMLCCLARESRPSFGEREVRLLRGLAESVRSELQAIRR